MSSFDLAIPVVLAHEGGWVNDPNDQGGETNWGISTLMVKRLQANKKLTDQQVADMLGLNVITLWKTNYMKPMTQEKAVAIYKSEFWDPFHLDQLNDQTTATKIFDCGVNCSPHTAALLAQAAAKDCGQAITVDGVLGPKSMGAINAVQPPSKFVLAMAQEMEKFYRGRVASVPTNAKFLNNWLKRAYWGV